MNKLKTMETNNFKDLISLQVKPRGIRVYSYKREGQLVVSTPNKYNKTITRGGRQIEKAEYPLEGNKRIMSSQKAAELLTIAGILIFSLVK